MAGKSDLKYCKNDMRTMRKHLRTAMKAHLKAARRSLKRNVRISLDQSRDPVVTVNVNYIY